MSVLTEQPVLAHDVHLERDPRCVVIKGGLAGVKARILLPDLRLEHHRVSIHLDVRAIAPEKFICLLIIGEMLHFYFDCLFCSSSVAAGHVSELFLIKEKKKVGLRDGKRRVLTLCSLI